MEYLFQSLGNEYQICGLSLVFATSRHGYWLTTLYANTGKAEGTKGMFFCVKTSTGTVFGGFCNVLFKITQACHIGGDASFVFTLKPKRAVYKSAGSNTFFLCCDNKHFTFGGGGKGEAIRIDEDFATGVSYPSATFANRPLAGEAANGQFGCSDFEVYVLR